MLRFLLLTLMLSGFTLPLSAWADNCRQKDIDISSSASGVSYLEAEKYCFSVIVSGGKAHKIRVEWNHERTELDPLQLKPTSTETDTGKRLEGKTREEIQRLMETKYTVSEYTGYLNPGDKLTATIWVDTPASDDPTLQVAYQVEPDGKWQLGYGFLFLPGRDREYYSMKDTEGSGYHIRRKDSNGGLTFAPALIWSWSPNQRNCFGRDVADGFTCSFAAGIAADSSSPILFGGLQATYHQNIGFNLGVAIHQQKRLAGEYHNGDPLTEAIQSDTLNHSVYRPNLYFGISFRFDKSPF